jgi:hypothetical protein
MQSFQDDLSYRLVPRRFEAEPHPPDTPQIRRCRGIETAPPLTNKLFLIVDAVRFLDCSLHSIFSTNVMTGSPSSRQQFPSDLGLGYLAHLLAP